MFCTKCNNDKLEDEFPFRNKAKNRRHRKCKQCTKERSAEHYLDNKASYIANAKRGNRVHGLLIRQFIWDFLKEHPCVDCLEEDPIVLEFDHIERITKHRMISYLRSYWSNMDRVRSEIAKCQVRCSNCHTRRTAEQFGWYKDIVK